MKKSSTKFLGHENLTPVLSDWPVHYSPLTPTATHDLPPVTTTASNTNNPTSIHEILDTGFIITIDENGNAVCAPGLAPIAHLPLPHPDPVPMPAPAFSPVDDNGGFILTIDENGNLVCGGAPQGITGKTPLQGTGDADFIIRIGEDGTAVCGPGTNTGTNGKTPASTDSEHSSTPIAVADVLDGTIHGFDNGGFILTIDKDGNLVCGGGTVQHALDTFVAQTTVTALVESADAGAYPSTHAIFTSSAIDDVQNAQAQMTAHAG